MIDLILFFVALWTTVLLTIWLAPKWNHPVNPLAWVFTFYRTERDKERYINLWIHWPRKPSKLVLENQLK